MVGNRRLLHTEEGLTEMIVHDGSLASFTRTGNPVKPT